jgi:hypothetical protein
MRGNARASPFLRGVFARENARGFRRAATHAPRRPRAISVRGNDAARGAFAAEFGSDFRADFRPIFASDFAAGFGLKNTAGRASFRAPLRPR